MVRSVALNQMKLFVKARLVGLLTAIVNGAVFPGSYMSEGFLEPSPLTCLRSFSCFICVKKVKSCTDKRVHQLYRNKYLTEQGCQNLFCMAASMPFIVKNMVSTTQMNTTPRALNYGIDF